MLRFISSKRRVNLAAAAAMSAALVAASSSVQAKDGFLVLASQHSVIGAAITKEGTDNADTIDMLAPMWFGAGDDGAVAPLPQLDESKGTIATYVADAHQRGMKVMPIIRNFKPQPLLADAAAIDRCVVELEQLCLDHKLDGLVIDFEHLKPASRQPLVTLLSKLHAKLKPRQLTLAVAVLPHTWEDEIDYKAVNENSDLLYVMFYDYTGPWKKQDGPTAPLTWPSNSRDITRDLDGLLAKGVDPAKILMGLPSYGGDFTLDAAGKMVEVRVDYIDDLRALLKKHGAAEQWDDARQCAFGEYTDAAGQLHRVWFDTAKSYDAKIKLAKSKHLAGAAMWAIRYADRISSSDLWSELKKKPDASAE